LLEKKEFSLILSVFFAIKIGFCVQKLKNWACERLNFFSLETGHIGHINREFCDDLKKAKYS
jgi:uncharacterized membrane protein YraQ (UPF0718 family)